MSVEYSMARRIHNKTCVKRFDKPVTCGLPLHLDTRNLIETASQFRHGECLRLTPAQVLLRWVRIPKSINSGARPNDLLVTQQRACARSDAGRESFAQRSPISERCSF